MKHKILLLAVVFLAFAASVAAASDLNPLLQASRKYQDVRVARALAVDLVLLETGEKVSLIGIKGPKPPRQRDVRRDKYGFIIPEDDPTTPFDLDALRFVRGVVEGQSVRLEFDVQGRNSDGILQAYIILADGRLLNAELLRFGYADLKLVAPNMKYAQKLREAYQEARREMRGMQGDR